MEPTRGAAVILAAGLSSRMGRCKALLTCRGVSFLRGLCDRLSAAGIEDRWVVLGPASTAARDTLPADWPDARVLFNPAPERGMLSSLHLALQALPPAIAWLLVAPVDHPAVRTETLRLLVQAADAAPGNAIVLPRSDQRRGHPVVFGRALFPELLALPADQGAREVVRRDPARVREIAVEDPGVWRDVDTPADYEELTRWISTN